jgi:uncharacterized protein (DUF58 family)
MTGARFVDPRVLARIGNLELLARSVVDGFINGLHKAPYFGVSLDFAEHRGYVPGDDIRRVDWRVFARTDRFYVKQYDADTNTNFSVILDVSRSMGYGSAGITKLDYARYLAACLTYFAHLQRDRIGLVTYDREIVERVPPSAKHLEVILHTLDRAVAGRPGDLKGPLSRMAEHFRRRGIVALVSDLYEEPDTILETIRPYRYLGNDVIVFHLLDPAEIEFSFDQPSNFEDLETGDRLQVLPKSLRDEYRALVREHIATISSKCSENRIDYALFDTSKPLDEALFRYLSSRERFRRVR